MATANYVKVYYTKQQQQTEIRRFSIDISPSNNAYQELCTKVATFQPDIQLNGFTLQYIDEENERITFSSDEELRSAVTSNKDSNTLKVFVVPNQSINQQENTNNKEVHVGVECDNCKGSVVGFRYKCVVCPNYDLCEKCSSAGIHSEHNMIKIAKPGNFYHPYGSRQHNRRFRHTIAPPFIPNPEFFERIQAQIPQWLPNREHAEQFRTHIQHHLSSIRSNTQAHMENSKQYLENVGQYLQQTLAPFGIDCDYRVDDNSSTSTTNNQQQASSNENADATEPNTASQTSNTNREQQRGLGSWLNFLRSNLGDTTTTTTATATAAAASGSNETLSSQTPGTPSSSSEKAIEECIDKMKAMGFNDKDESLLQLIRSKNGDLISVLDEMMTRLP